MNKFKIAILLITYKRPKYLRKVLLKIKKINPSILYIYSDGPKNKEESFDVKMCRSIIDDIKWCSVKKKFNTKNMGIELVPKLAIDWVFKENEMAIILEDDTLPSTSFFYFCKKLLIKYKNNTKISMICGTNLAQEKSKNIKDSYFFSKYSNIWGWATWRRAWKHFELKMPSWHNKNKDEFHGNSLVINNLHARDIFFWELISHPFVFRKRKMKRSEFPEQLRLAIADLIRDMEISKQCYLEGYDKNWSVDLNTNMWMDVYKSKKYVFIKTKDSVVKLSLEDSLSTKNQLLLQSLNFGDFLK